MPHERVGLPTQPFEGASTPDALRVSSRSLCGTSKTTRVPTWERHSGSPSVVLGIGVGDIRRKDVPVSSIDPHNIKESNDGTRS
jgi:hypothetical protein